MSRKTKISEAIEKIETYFRKILQGIYQEKQKLAELTLARYQSYKNAQEDTLGCVSRKTEINETTIKNAKFVTQPR